MPAISNPPDRDVVVDVAENLTPRPFGAVVRTAADHVSDPGVSGVKVACDLHRLVRTRVDYREYANFRRDPRETLEHGGNCVDTTCLYCSMLIRAGFDCRFVLLTLPTRGHLYLEVLISGDQPAIVEDVHDYYAGRPLRAHGEITTLPSDDGDGQWVVADPATADSFGDARGLATLGYLDADNPSGGSLSFRSDVERYAVSFQRRPSNSTSSRTR